MTSPVPVLTSSPPPSARPGSPHTRTRTRRPDPGARTRAGLLRPGTGVRPSPRPARGLGPRHRCRGTASVSSPTCGAGASGAPRVGFALSLALVLRPRHRCRGTASVSSPACGARAWLRPPGHPVRASPCHRRELRPRHRRTGTDLAWSPACGARAWLRPPGHPVRASPCHRRLGFGLVTGAGARLRCRHRRAALGLGSGLRWTPYGLRLVTGAWASASSPVHGHGFGAVTGTRPRVRPPARARIRPRHRRRVEPAEQRVAQPRPPPSAATADLAALIAPLLMTSVPGAFLLSKSLPL